MMYFWKEGKVITASPMVAEEAVKAELLRLPCVDTDYSPDNPTLRYGEFSSYCWDPLPPSKFPTAFKATLLIMGVEF